MSTEQGAADDPAIGPDEILYRRVPPVHIKDDGSISRAAFQNYRGTDAMSVHVDSIIRRQGRLPEDLLASFEGYTLIAMRAADVRDAGQRVRLVPEGGDDAHAHVIGEKKKAAQRLIRDRCWVVAKK